MTEDLKRFCNRLEMLLNVMKHRDNVNIDLMSSLNRIIFKHEIKIERINITQNIPILEIMHTVFQEKEKVLIETYTYADILMLKTSYFWGYYGGISTMGANVEEMEFIDRLRLYDEDSIINFDELIEQMDLYAVRVL